MEKTSFYVKINELSGKTTAPGQNKSPEALSAPGPQTGSSPASTAAGADFGRAKAPGPIHSPGAQHSSTAEIAPQQLQPTVLHPDSPLSKTHLITRFMGSIIARLPGIVNPHFKQFSGGAHRNKINPFKTA
jgi:hypothetical protein